MANLLQKASIVLTPTAYDDGKVLCAKPSEPPYGDFDFSRNSAATRVNAQGLVENVQILSSNLVQNGDFSEEGAEEVSNGSFSQEGVELVTNGDFSNGSTNWNLGASWSIVNEKAVNNGLSNSFLTQNSIVQNGKSYLVSFDIADMTQGSLQLRFGSGAIVTESFTSNGTKTSYYVSSGDAINFYSVSGFDGSIDNVSVREVGQDWDLSSSNISIGEDKLVCNNVLENSAIATQVNVVPVQKQVKVQFDIVVNSGSFRMLVGSGGTTTIVTTSGTYTFYETSGTGGNLNLQARAGGFDGSITNISVKEVLQDWTAISSSALSIDNGALKISNVTQGYGKAGQSFSTISGKTYKIKFDGFVGTAAQFQYRLGTTEANTNIAIQAYSTNQTIEAQFIALSSLTYLTFVTQSAATGVYTNIDNVSVIEITDDTNLPRINYEGFSYQDALGSELVVNGAFSSDTAWSLNNGATISDGKANIVGDGTAFTYISQGGVFTSGKQYIVKLDVIINSGLGLKFQDGANNENIGFATTSGTYTFNFTATSNSNILIARRTGGTPFNSSVDNVSVKEYLGQEVVPDSGCGSWLFEPQSTNLLPYSEDFSQYSSGNTPIVTGGFLAPDGTNNAYKITDSGSSTLYLSGIPNLSSTDTRSIYARSVSGTGTATLMSYFGNTNNVFTLTEDWQRFEVNGTDAVAGEDNFYAADFRGSGTLNEYIIWGAQIEALSYATSYIPTSGSTATRNQDVCTNGGSLASINSTEGVLYAEIAALANDLTDRDISISDGTNNNVVRIRLSRFSNNIGYYVLSNGVTTVGALVSGQTQTNTNKIAVKYKQDDFALWVNGVEVATDTSGNTPIGLSSLQFTTGNVALPFFGKTKALAVFPYLTDQELTELTTI